jgi:hypothetical protein
MISQLSECYVNLRNHMDFLNITSYKLIYRKMNQPSPLEVIPLFVHVWVGQGWW